MKKLIAVLAVMVAAFALFGCSDEGATEGGVGLTLDIDNSRSIEGKVWGAAIVNDNESYDIYFGDENGKRLTEYTKIGVAKGENGCELDGLVLPPKAKTVVAVGKGGKTAFCALPKRFTVDYSNPYIFGALSDVHYNKYYATGDDDALAAFDRALDYFDKIGVDMVGVAGDISNDGEEDSLIKFNEAISGRDYPVFTVAGNHDYKAYKNGLWQQYITDNVKGCEMSEYGGDFMYAPKGANGDVFVFLNITYWTYDNKIFRALMYEQIDWLESILKTHTDNQVYLFFHLFLCGPDGQKHTGVGNIMNPGGYTYPLPYHYANADERVFRRMMKNYKNVVYLSGHSHWMFEMEIYGEQANFSDFGGQFCSMVHIPSVTEPRWIGEFDTDRTGKNGECSEGWVIYDCGDITVLLPVDFVSGTVYTEYMEIVHK
ncbi:MAG: metallophosphoesterase [Clostridia bacterium]|nr:metallophosphoesterase [Clostridia bacterium]